MSLYLPKAYDWKREYGWLVVNGPPDLSNSCTELQYRIVERADRDIGIMESPPGSNRGTRIDEYVRRAGLGHLILDKPGERKKPGPYWCAIWAGNVFGDCGCLVPKNYPGTDYWTPYLVDEPVIGAAVLYGTRKKGPVRKDMDAYHIGIVVRIEKSFTWPYNMLTIEGNRAFAGTSNNGVAVDIGPPARRDILGYFHPRTS